MKARSEMIPEIGKALVCNHLAYLRWHISKEKIDGKYASFELGSSLHTYLNFDNPSAALLLVSKWITIEILSRVHMGAMSGPKNEVIY